MKEVVIVAAGRSPIGNFGGCFKNVSAVDLGRQVLTQLLAELNLEPNQIDEVIIGNVLSSGLGQNVARQVAIQAGLPHEVSAYAVNKVCGSGLKAITLAAQAIMTGEHDIVVAGGIENMSQAPYLSSNARWGQRLGHQSLIDSILSEGLTDAFEGIHMGLTAENIAEKYGYTRQQQDEFACQSQARAAVAIQAQRFKEEIVPIRVPQRKQEDLLVTQDEFPRFDTSMDSLAKLRPAFKSDGTVTAGNASGINDGAAMLILMSAEKAQSLGLQPLATIRSYASAGVDPQLMGLGPVPAVKKALAKANLKIEDVDLIEANEAFAAQALAVIDQLELDPNRVNVNGGAIALGHPIGASGARILVTLIYEMIKRQDHYGLASLCIGGGQGIALVIER
ncbi:acetyl-CoA C-acetyltransferase [Vaginisenegalia massiliensis]|uniref:acetyl-CoA C-acetyltransferase n=1 Tax=Vaginisenegalia massiliensis TaxID=2058294 RepID=UPI000F54B0D2|nr:acetyl-CoA C-acetyltransferase [Vaginisenegalia massiliensis]